MRILCVAVYQSNHCDRHLNLLARAGHDVHLAVLDPASRPCLALHPGVTVHARQQHAPPPQLSFPQNEGREARFGDQELLAMADIALPCRGAVAAAQWIASLIDQLAPQVVHSFSLHQSSFLVAASRNLCEKPFPRWIVSNWGCDIHYFGREERYRHAITATLRSVNGYFAECARDARLARALGLTAPVLAIQPIGGSFDLEWFYSLRSAGSSGDRRWIMLKGYGGLLGRAETALDALCRLGSRLREYPLAIYARGFDEGRLDALTKAGLNFQILPFLSYDDLMRWHGKARCSISLSESDGICTSAIEAMLMGSLPLQSDSSCLAEWTDVDSTLLVPCNDPDAVELALHRCLNDEFVNWCVERNDRVLRERFSAAAVDHQIAAMYEQLA